MPKEKQESKKNLAAPLVAGTLGAAGIYSYYRKPKGAMTQLRKAYEEGGNNLTIGVSYGASKLRKALTKAFYSTDVNVKKINEKKVSSSPGVFFNKNIVENSKEIAPAVINDKKSAKLMEELSGKDSLTSLPGIGKYFPNTRKLSDTLKNEGYDLNKVKNWKKEEFDSAFKNIENKYGPQFLKPNSGQSMGKGTDNIYADLNNATTKKKVKPTGIKKYFTEHSYKDNPQALKELRSNLDNYIISDNLGKNKEVRIHTLNGEIVDTVRRFGAMEGTQTGVKLDKSLQKQFSSDLKELYKAKGLKGKNISLAFDAYQSKNSKGVPELKLIEANPNSGFLFDLNPVTKPKEWVNQRGYWSSHRLYEKITGKKTTTASGIRAGLGGAGIATGTHTINKKFRDGKKEK